MQWTTHQGRSHENLSGQVILPQHSGIVSIKIVSGFSTCNNNRTVTILFKKCYHYKCTSNEELYEIIYTSIACLVSFPDHLLLLFSCLCWRRETNNFLCLCNDGPSFFYTYFDLKSGQVETWPTWLVAPALHMCTLRFMIWIMFFYSWHIVSLIDL